MKDFYRLANATTTPEGIEMAHQLLMELGNRRESKDAEESKNMKTALAEAGLAMYKEKIISQAAAQQARQADKDAAQAARAAAVNIMPVKEAPTIASIPAKSKAAETKPKIAQTPPKQNPGRSFKR